MEKVNCCTTRCGHKFCLTCFVRHSKGDIYAKCPLCRTTITDAPEPPPRYAPYDDLDDDELAQWIWEATSSDDESDDEIAHDEIAHDEIAHESSSDDTDLDFLPTMSFLRSLINPVATREEREHALQQVWHT